MQVTVITPTVDVDYDRLLLYLIFVMVSHCSAGVECLTELVPWCRIL